MMDKQHCWIDGLPPEILLEIFERLDWQSRLRAEIVSRKWRYLLKEKAWLRFTQFHQTRQYSVHQMRTLLTRFRPFLREWHYSAPSMDSLDEPSSAACHIWKLHKPRLLLPKLDTLCITGRVDDPSALLPIICAQIRCLHILNYSVVVYWALRDAKLLRYLCVKKAGQTMVRLLRGRNIRHLELEELADLDCISPLGMSSNFPVLIGLSFSLFLENKTYMLNEVNRFSQCASQCACASLKQLQLLEIKFTKKPKKPTSGTQQVAIRNFMKSMVSLVTNVRILTLTCVDGQVLTEIVRHCPLVEQLEYWSRQASVFNAFCDLCKLSRLCVLRVHHYGAATSCYAPPVMVDTLREIANAGHLEHLSLNVHLPMELVLHIVHKCPRLNYLEYKTACPNNLRPIAEALDEVAAARQYAPLQFRIFASSWWTFQNGLVNRQHLSALLEVRFRPPNVAATRVMREHWARVFEGGHVPEFVLRQRESEKDALWNSLWE